MNCRIPVWKDDLCKRHHPEKIAEDEDCDLARIESGARRESVKYQMLFVGAWMRKHEVERFKQIAAKAHPADIEDAERALSRSDYV